MIQAGRSRNPEWLGALLTVTLTAVMISFNATVPLSTYDGGISASAATFTLHGLLPYRDYWLLYGPLSGFLLAIPTALLGPSIELTRGFGFVLFCCEAVVAYRLARVWAARVPAIALSVSAVVMTPAMTSLDLSAWPIAMTFALAALYVSIGTGRSGIVIGLLVGFAFLSRLDVGAYALLSVLVVRDRRAVLLGFALIAIPFVAFALATTAPSSLFEQLIWFPLVGTRQFRSLPGPEVMFGQPTAALLSLPLLLLPRIAIAVGAIRLALIAAQGRRDPRFTGSLALVVFAASCQLQTLGRADVEHFSQAATPGLLLFALWFSTARPNLVRFSALTAITAAAMVVGLIGHRLHPDALGYDRTLIATSDWVRAATNPEDRIFVGLTSHRYTVRNPLIVYYLADRAPGVHDTMFNPGVTNTDWGQTRMVGDLERTAAPYLVLDRPSAGASEPCNDSRIPGSTMLDDYITAHYHTVCDLGSLVIQARNDLLRPAPPCPVIEPQVGEISAWWPTLARRRSWP